jgi:hypothetical protein
MFGIKTTKKLIKKIRKDLGYLRRFLMIPSKNWYIRLLNTNDIDRYFNRYNIKSKEEIILRHNIAEWNEFYLRNQFYFQKTITGKFAFYFGSLGSMIRFRSKWG